jgi:hypothetical protein
MASMGHGRARRPRRTLEMRNATLPLRTEPVGLAMRIWISTAVALLTWTAVACSVSGPGAAGDKRPQTTPEQTTTGERDTPEPLAETITSEDYDPALFEDPANVDNRWYPLSPGTRLSYRGSSVEDGELLRHSVDVVVTDLTKDIDGVSNLVVWERDYTESVLVESEIALFAQDKYGNVWHMGEYPEEYEDGDLDKAPAWIHGIRGALAGITIQGIPQVGTPDYAQGYAPPPINWVDRGKVYRTDEKTCVPAGCYDDVVVIEEFETGLPDAFQDKYYAPGVGVVRVGWRGSRDDSKEMLELVAITQLTPVELADARAGVLALEARAYRISEDVYGRTPPAEPLEVVNTSFR